MQLLRNFYAPKGTRTPVLALRGPRPGPLDDGGVSFTQAGRILPCSLQAVNNQFCDGTHERSIYPSKRRMTRVVLCPPKPNEFDRVTSTGARRAILGT